MKRISKTKFYFYAFLAEIALIFLVGLTRNQPFFKMFGIVLVLALLSYFLGLALKTIAAVIVVWLMPKLDKLVEERLKIELIKDRSEGEKIFTGITVNAMIICVFLTVLFNPFRTYVNVNYTKHAWMNNNMLAELATASIGGDYEFKDKYHVLLDDKNISEISKTALQRLNDPQKLKQVAFKVAETRSIGNQSSDEFIIFTTALDKIRKASNQEVLYQLYSDIRKLNNYYDEQKLIEIIARIDDKNILQRIVGQNEGSDDVVQAAKKKLPPPPEPELESQPEPQPES